MGEVEVAWLRACRLHENAVAKELSPVEVTQHQLVRIDRWAPPVHALITVAGDHALGEYEHAKQAVSRGDSVGPSFGSLVGLAESSRVHGNGPRGRSASLAHQAGVA